MMIDREQERMDAEELQILIHSPGWKVFLKHLNGRRMMALDALAIEESDREIHRLQGAVQAIDQVKLLPQQVIEDARNQNPESAL